MGKVVVWSDGRVLEVRRVGDVKIKFVARPEGPPIKPHSHGWRIYEEEQLVELLRELADSGMYERLV